MGRVNRTKAEFLKYLESKIQRIEGVKADSGMSPISLHPEMDAAFPNNAFPIGAVHEFFGHEGYLAPAFGFMAGVISFVAGKDRPALWITKSQEVFAQGLTLFGIEPHHILFIRVHNDKEALWAMEEGLRCKSLAVAVCEIRDADLTATRRLQLAVEHSGVTGFVLRQNPKHTMSSACFSSWCVRSLPSKLEDGMPGVGFPRWKVELRRIRNGQPKSWDVEWKAGRFHTIMESQLQDRVPEKVYAR